ACSNGKHKIFAVDFQQLLTSRLPKTPICARTASKVWHPDRHDHQAGPSRTGHWTSSRLARYSYSTTLATLPLLEAALKDLRDKYPSVRKVEAQGYCWGGKYVVILGSYGPDKISAVSMQATATEVEAINCRLCGTGPSASPSQFEEIAAKVGVPVTFKRFEKVFSYKSL
ncbi:hypothetical protein BC938DRAFT_479047, partial [Jimgerdemannia flammicorona]